MIEAKNKLILKSIRELFEYNFKIPSYQRGYRWTPFQVEQLLDDILSFSKREKTKGEFYCLQPVVVSKVGESYEVIDGQQRITTIYLIIKYLEDVTKILFLDFQLPELSYETREDSREFLKNITTKYQSEEKDSNIDFFHLSEAFDCIKNWFEKGKANKFNFINTLLEYEPGEDEQTIEVDVANNIRVIWYEIDNPDFNNTIDVFIRLNIGKIGLTNAELIKALLLQKSNFEKDNVSLRQIQIASEWDSIEKSLQNDSFWFFIYNKSNPLKYENRIEYIFDLIKGRDRDSEYYYTFNEFNKQFLGQKNSEIIDEVWMKVKEFYLTLDEWYNDYELYHLIGFLIDSDEDILSIIKESRERKKIDFKENYIQKRIREKVNRNHNLDLNEIEYGKDSKSIKRILLLFNIVTILESKKSEMRFPFHKYKSEDWDIEHISSLSDEKINPGKRQDWINDLLEYFIGDSDEKSCESWIENKNNKNKRSYQLVESLLKFKDAKKIDEIEFGKLFEEVRAFFEGNDNMENKNHISNLALLDSSTNRSYGNSFFAIKRGRIIDNDSKGLFVPIATKNVFLKYYSKVRYNLNFMYWNEKDADDYFNSICSKLKKYLTSEEENNKND